MSARSSGATALLDSGRTGIAVLGALLCSITGLGTGCAPDAGRALDVMEPAELSDPLGTSFFATFAGARDVSGLLFADFIEIAAGDDKYDGCPRILRDGNSTRIETGCEASDGLEWTGTVDIDLDEDGAGVIEVRNFGTRNESECDGSTLNAYFRRDGEVVLTRTADDTIEYDVKMTYTLRDWFTDWHDEVPDDDPLPCDRTTDVFAVEYVGTIVSGVTEAHSGAGRIGFTPFGVVDASTVDQIFDAAVCTDEHVSGVTIFISGADEAVITYDGATDCDSEDTVAWSLNGVDQGELERWGCTISGLSDRGPGALSLLVFTVLAGFALRRRRRVRPA